MAGPRGDWKRGPQRRKQLFPQLESRPDLRRGEERLAAEAALAMLGGSSLPVNVEIRAIETLSLMASS